MGAESHYPETTVESSTVNEQEDSVLGSTFEKGSLRRVYRFALALLLLGGGLAVFMLGSPYFDIFPTNRNPYFLLGLALSFLAAVLFLPFSKRFKHYRPAAYAFFTASCVTLVVTLGPLNFLIRDETVMQELVTDKLVQALYIVVPIIILTKLAGQDLGPTSEFL